MPIINAGGRYQAGIGLSEPIPWPGGAPVSSVAATYNTAAVPGTLAGVAPTGALLNDFTNARIYQNTGTMALPTWTKVSAET